MSSCSSNRCKLVVDLYRAKKKDQSRFCGASLLRSECKLYLLTVTFVMDEEILNTAIDWNPLDRFVFFFWTSPEGSLSDFHVFSEPLLDFLRHILIKDLDVPVSADLLSNNFL